MSPAAECTYILVICLVAGVLGQTLGAYARLPSIVFLLATGVALGPDALGTIDPQKLGRGLEVIVRLSVAFILFEGSMALRLDHIRKVHLSVRRLISLGVALTFVLATGAAHLIGGLPIKIALLFGALVTVTGPTVIRPIVQRVRVRPELAAVMEGEGILADPIGAILAAVCLEYALAPAGTALGALGEFALRMGTGAAVGAVAGTIAGFIVKFRTPSVERIKPLVVLACALGAYQGAELLRHEAGIMACVAAGLAVQHGLASHDRELREFKQLLTDLLLAVLFVLLAANLRRFRMEAEGLRGLLTVAAVMFVIRPINVFVCTAGGRPTFREKLFLAWVAPRGIVAASVASLGALVLEQRGYPDAHRVESLVFLTIFLTVFLQGATAKLVAAALGITVKDARAVLIVGANAIGRAIGEAFKAAGKEVAVVDRNPALVEEAQRAGLRAIVGDATDRATLHMAGLDEADIFVAVTPSSVVNQTAAIVALHESRFDHVWVSLDLEERQKLDPILERAGAEVAFARPIPFSAWLHALQSDSARLVDTTVTEHNRVTKPLGQVAFADSAVPVFVRRNNRLELVHSASRLQVGDRVTILTWPQTEDAVHRTLGVAAASS